MVSASRGSSNRQFDGWRPDCEITRAASAPAAKLSKRTGREALKRGRGRTRTQASVITPRMPSEPRIMRSGLGPAPEPGSLRLSQTPVGVSAVNRVDQVVDVGLQGGEMAARPGRDPAAKGGELERLGKMAQGEPAGPQAVLEVGPERPGPDQGRARDLVDLDDPGQRTEVDRDGPAVAVSDPGLDPADDARAAAEGHRRQPPVGAHLQHPPDVLGVAREGDHVGGPVEPPAEAADDVAIGAPHRVPDPVRRIGAEDVAELVGRAQPGRSWLDRGERHRLLDRVSAEAEPAAHLGRDRLQRRAGRSPLGVTPPPMAPGRAAGPRSARFHDPTLPTRPRIH